MVIGDWSVIATPAGDLDTDVMQDDQRVAEVAVGDGMLDFIVAPYVVWNADTGASVLVEVDDRTLIYHVRSICINQRRNQAS
ncbi:MAG: hypothetical protein F6K62_07570 [Sphaerospermopsis sp. SIO1G2]|nr:hypothetical protein [Sphaerospermopsis sp. SIO1G2]